MMKPKSDLIQTLSSSRKNFIGILVAVLIALNNVKQLFDSSAADRGNIEMEFSYNARGDFKWKKTLDLFYRTQNVTDSLKILFKTALNSSVALADDNDENINPEIERERCDRYGYKYGNRTSRRRIFWGSLLADDSWHVLSIAAIEYYGLLSTVALVESNTTQMLYPRTIRFPSGSERLKILCSPLLWGPKTKVSVDYYYDPPNETRKGIRREHLQRDLILERWKANGMTHEDIGFLSDVDEIASRDFLRALQICDVPEFAPGNTCINPKISAKMIQFEGSPTCLNTFKTWLKPDMVIGECVDQIGNITLHPPAKRVLKFGANMREKGWQSNLTMGPLWEATDFRRGPGQPATGRHKSHVAYHLHNFFDSIELLRNKYETYGHPVANAKSKPLVDIHEAIGLMLDCLMWKNISGTNSSTIPVGYQSFKSDQMPLAFKLAPLYPDLRHSELQKMLAWDQQLYPPAHKGVNDLPSQKDKDLSVQPLARSGLTTYERFVETQTPF